jgi:predicted PurR-regulated permease PerM
LIKNFFQEEAVKKFGAVIILILLLFSVRGLINLILLTFLFTYLLYTFQQFLYKKVNLFIPVKSIFITLFMYILLIFGFVFTLVRYIPLLMQQLMVIGREFSSFSIDKYTMNLDPKIVSLIKNINIGKYLKEAGDALINIIPHISEVSIQFFIAFLLSFFFIIERNEIIRFGKKIEASKLSFYYSYYSYFGKNFLNSFGKVLQMQILISLINGCLSVIMLAILGFSEVIGLGFMIFILGLIPVAGVAISFIPLAIIAFKIGGLSKVLAVVIMILVLHALESYVLNPKLMSIRTKLPIFFTFLTLTVAEHYLGIWGLLIGLPLLMFFLDMAGVNMAEPKKVKSK